MLRITDLTGLFMICRTHLSILLLVLLPVVAHAQSWMTESGHVEFHSSVPLHSFTGTSEQLTGRIALADSTVDFYVDLNTLETGVAKRDRDMRETLESEQFPFAEFFGTLTSPFDPNDTAPQKVTVTGTFTMHDVTRDITVEGTLTPEGDALHLVAEWTMNMADYDIEPPGILFYRVSEEIDVELEATLNPEEE